MSTYMTRRVNSSVAIKSASHAYLTINFELNKSPNHEVSHLTIFGVFSALFTLCLSCVARYDLLVNKD